MQDKYEIFAGNALFNIFNGALIPISKRELNQVRDYKVIGYRLESVKSEKVRVTARMPEDLNGVYTATTYFGGVRRKGKSTSSVFFPRDWTKDEVVEAIFEAYQNKAIRHIAERQYVGKTQKGMSIILWLDKAGKVIDAMPFRDLILEINRRMKAKKFCKICEQPKHYICLEHNPHKKKQQSVFNEIRKTANRFLRKVRFNFAGK
jgi:hypothetical protein